VYKIFFVLLFLLPTVAFSAVDVSDCEVIGYQQSPVTEQNCATTEKCQAEFATHKNKSALDLCLKNVKTPAECQQFIAEQQELARQELLIYKCPMTYERLQQKMGEKTSGGAQNRAYYNDETKIDPDELIADTEYVYLFRGIGSGIGAAIGVISEKDKGRVRYRIIGPADDEHGLVFSVFQE